MEYPVRKIIILVVLCSLVSYGVMQAIISVSLLSSQTSQKTYIELGTASQKSKLAKSTQISTTKEVVMDELPINVSVNLESVFKKSPKSVITTSEAGFETPPRTIVDPTSKFDSSPDNPSSMGTYDLFSKPAKIKSEAEIQNNNELARFQDSLRNSTKAELILLPRITLQTTQMPDGSILYQVIEKDTPS
jgi:hypothetical protein